jgi:hypothetical protein
MAAFKCRMTHGFTLAKRASYVSQAALVAPEPDKMAIRTTPIRAVLARAASKRAVFNAKAEGSGTLRKSMHQRMNTGIEKSTRRKGDDAASIRNVKSSDTPRARRDERDET